jgi:hypothetical protein
MEFSKFVILSTVWYRFGKWNEQLADWVIAITQSVALSCSVLDG